MTFDSGAEDPLPPPRAEAPTALFLRLILPLVLAIVSAALVVAAL